MEGHYENQGSQVSYVNFKANKLNFLLQEPSSHLNFLWLHGNSFTYQKDLVGTFTKS
jgi:hypothetical protein